METIKEILLALVAAMVCGIGSYLLRQYKQNILTMIADLVQKAEEAVQGSGMGAEKKPLSWFSSKRRVSKLRHGCQPLLTLS